MLEVLDSSIKYRWVDTPLTRSETPQQKENEFPKASEVLDELERFDRDTQRTPIIDFQVLDKDRRSEVLDKVNEITDLENNQWMEGSGRDLEIDWEALKEEKPFRENILSKLEEKYRPEGTLLKLTVDLPEDMPFKPGDYYSIKLPETPDLSPQKYNIPEQCSPIKESNSRPYSVASSPNSEHLDFYIKVIPDEAADENSLTPVLKPKLDHLDELLLRGPFSDELSLFEDGENDMLYVATGTGMAPHKSMTDFVYENFLDQFSDGEREVFALFGTTYLDELPGRREFQVMDAKYENFHFIPVLSREELLTDWNGETGHVQNSLTNYIEGSSEDPAYDIDAEIDPENTDVYGCGNGRMIEGLKQVLEEEGFNQRRCQFEAFY